ncbi:MAG TPA: hypothetical protein VMZ50_08945 [Phycisphaerae bacterium]|nr:hypothetical protein [Phycisphaerae bacterium]
MMDIDEEADRQRRRRIYAAAWAVVEAHADEEDLCHECGCDECCRTREAVAVLRAAMEPER